MAVKITLKSVTFHVRNLRTRLPFRYGIVTLTRFPLLHLAVDVEAADGRRARGFAADNLPPKWFDKDPAKSFRENVADLLASIRAAHAAYLDAARSPRPVFEIRLDAYADSRGRAAALGLNALTASFGSALFERAVVDAAGRLAGQDLVEMLRLDTLAIRPEAVHAELGRGDVQGWAQLSPPGRIAVRHTVGPLDPIVAADVPADGRLEDVPVVPVQQDLATVRALGITHAERNGHHYVRGLAHCAPRERDSATRLHADLYRGDEAEASLRIEGGQLSVGSLAVPGYGVAFDPDLESMGRLEDWSLDSLEAST